MSCLLNWNYEITIWSPTNQRDFFQVEEMVKKLQQEARDGVEEKKIGERKSVAMVSFLVSLDPRILGSWDAKILES